MSSTEKVAEIIKMLREALLRGVYASRDGERAAVVETLREIARILSTANSGLWPLITEDDVIHVEFHDSNMYVYLRNGGVYQVEKLHEEKYTLDYRRVVECI